MGSRFMHLLAAEYVATEIGIRDRGGMLLGAIAPDAVPHKALDVCRIVCAVVDMPKR